MRTRAAGSRSLRVYLGAHVDLELTGETARAYAAADEQGQRDMASRLLAGHIEMAGAEEAGIVVGSEIVTIQDVHIGQIAEAVNRRIPRAAGVTAIAVWPDRDHVRVEIQADRPGAALGHSRAEYDRLRAELAELAGTTVQLQIVKDVGPPEGRTGVRAGPGRPTG